MKSATSFWNSPKHKAYNLSKINVYLPCRHGGYRPCEFKTQNTIKLFVYTKIFISIRFKWFLKKSQNLYFIFNDQVSSIRKIKAIYFSNRWIVSTHKKVSKKLLGLHCNFLKSKTPKSFVDNQAFSLGLCLIPYNRIFWAKLQ